MDTHITTVQAVITVSMIAIGAGGFGWFNILRTTNKLIKEQNNELRAQNEVLKQENKQWYEKHIENERAISELKGKIDTLTKIPLNGIDKSLAELSKSNGEILECIKLKGKV